MVKEFECIKQDSIIKIDVSFAAYFAIKQHMLTLLEGHNTNELFVKIIDSPDTLETNEYTIKVLLDFISEIEKTAIANKQTEMISIEVTGLPDEEPKDPS